MNDNLLESVTDEKHEKYFASCKFETQEQDYLCTKNANQIAMYINKNFYKMNEIEKRILFKQIYDDNKIDEELLYFELRFVKLDELLFHHNATKFMTNTFNRFRRLIKLYCEDSEWNMYDGKIMNDSDIKNCKKCIKCDNCKNIKSSIKDENNENMINCEECELCETCENIKNCEYELTSKEILYENSMISDDRECMTFFCNFVNYIRRHCSEEISVKLSFMSDKENIKWILIILEYNDVLI